MSEDLSEKWVHGPGGAATGVDPRPRPQDAVLRLESGRWAPDSGRHQPGPEPTCIAIPNSYIIGTEPYLDHPFDPPSTATPPAAVASRQNGSSDHSQSVAGSGNRARLGASSGAAERFRSYLRYGSDPELEDEAGVDNRPQRSSSYRALGSPRSLDSDVAVGRRAERTLEGDSASQVDVRLRPEDSSTLYESARARRARLSRTADDVHQENEVEDSNRWRSGVEWAIVLVASVLIALVVQTLLIQAFWIPSESMESTLQFKDRVFVDKLGYRFQDMERGEIIVFEKTDDEIKAQPDEPKHLIKRIIGLPGETLEIANGQVMIDGQPLVEPYVKPGEVNREFGAIVIPDGHFFVMGDNREHSADSRFGLGPVAEDRVVGRAFVTFWPPGRAGGL